MYLLLETDRLFLKVLHENNAKEVLQFYLQNKGFLEPTEPQRVSAFYTEAFHCANLCYEYNEMVKRKFLRYWLYVKDNPFSIIGSICIQNILRGSFQSGNLGYKLGQDYQHKGYAAEALSAFLPLLWTDFNLHRIEAYILQDNYPSIKLIERFGFEKEGIAKSSVYINNSWKNQIRYAKVNE